MAYPETKVYFDGSHYIAIPYIPNPHAKKKRKPTEDVFDVMEEEKAEVFTAEGSDAPVEPLFGTPDEGEEEEQKESPPIPYEEELKGKKQTRKQIFENHYEETKEMKKGERKRRIKKAMRPYFKTEKETDFFVEAQFERKYRNLVSRRVRLMRKVNLQEFNYFCTFTYDGEKHTEESFKQKLKGCFKMMCHRRGWKYVGVWERSPKKKRLHFHGLFYIPEGAMVGELIEVNDYSPIKKKVQHTTQNTYFNERFGRSDFSRVYDRADLGDAVAYLVKYIEKSGEKIVYSKGLPQYFISDILDDDVVCPIGLEDRKLLLFDDFSCFDEGVYIGPVSKEVIDKMRKVN